MTSASNPPTRHLSRALLAVLWALACVGCPASELPKNGTLEAACCGGRGMCLPTSFLDAQALRLLGREACAEPLLCVPDELRNRELLKVCRASASRSEGRCLPACLPDVQARGAQLAVDGCDEHQRCVPCYDPITGANTQACNVAGDQASEPPATFADCCSGVGRCVPGSLLPNEQRSLLGPDSCSDSGDLCAPTDALMQGALYVPASCTTLGFASEGRCVPDCLPRIAQQKSRLGQAGCPEHSLCAPCFDPISGEATGSCTLGADHPSAPAPPLLASCCSQLAHCIPSQLLDNKERMQLGTDVCRGNGDMCVPDAFAASDFAPVHCAVSAAGGAEGRCLPDCLPQVSGQRDRLRQESCLAHHLCVPCVDPVSGTATGACQLGMDKGPAGPAQVFDSCCDGESRCVPQSEVPEAQRGLVGRDSCSHEEDLCVPSQIAADPKFAPSVCKVSELGAEGRCLLRCLPAVAERASALKQDGCPARQACVPCFDPASGKPSGACGLPGDKGPSQPPKLLPACCGDLGRCTPSAWIPEKQLSAFGPDSCAAESHALCVAPAAVLSDAQFIPQHCSEQSTGAEGRCVPSCLPALKDRAQFLARGACPEAHVCAPCFDPITGKATGACEFPADPGPVDKPVLFETCCGSSASSATGLCVPSSLIPAGAPELPKQTCTGKDAVCAPRALVNDPGTKFPICSSVATSKGVCIEACYLPSLAQAISFVGDCQSGQLCVACSLLGTAIGGCEP
jgi:hypothetical protein